MKPRTKKPIAVQEHIEAALDRVAEIEQQMDETNRQLVAVGEEIERVRPLARPIVFNMDALSLIDFDVLAEVKAKLELLEDLRTRLQDDLMHLDTARTFARGPDAAALAQYHAWQQLIEDLINNPRSSGSTSMFTIPQATQIADWVIFSDMPLDEARDRILNADEYQELEEVLHDE